MTRSAVCMASIMRSLAAAAAPCGTAALTPATASSSGQAIGSMPGMRCLGRTHSSSSSSSPCDTQHHRGQLQRRHGSATVDTCFPSHSDRVRRRRLTSASAAAAAAAQPALAADEVNGAWQALPPQQPALASLLLKPGRSGLLQQQAEVPGNQEVLWQAVQLPGSSPLAALETALLPRRAPFQLPVPNLGYTCMNKTLQQEHGVRTNRFRLLACSLPVFVLLPPCTTGLCALRQRPTARAPRWVSRCVSRCAVRALPALWVQVVPPPHL